MATQDKYKHRNRAKSSTDYRDTDNSNSFTASSTDGRKYSSGNIDDEMLIVKMNKSAEEVKMMIRQCENLLHSTLTSKQTIETECKSMANEVEQFATGIKRKMQEEFERVIKEIDSCSKAVLQELNETTSKEIEILDNHWEKTNATSKKLRKTLTTPELHSNPPIPSSRNQGEIIKHYQQLLERSEQDSENIIGTCVFQQADIDRWKTDVTRRIQPIVNSLSECDKLPSLERADLKAKKQDKSNQL